MTSLLFSETPAKGSLHLLPRNTTAISYNYSPDQLLLAAHLEDNCAKVDQLNPADRSACDVFFNENCYNCTHDNGRRCRSVQESGFNFQTVCPRGLEIPTSDKVEFDVAPAIFHCYLKLSQGERFQSYNSKAFLQGTTVSNKRIKLSRNRKPMANTWGRSNEDFKICWGGNYPPKSLRGMVKLFFDSPFNNDLVKIRDFVANNQVVKNDIQSDNYFRTYATRYTFITEKADALFLLHAEDNVAAFFWMLAAGFKPLKNANHLMLLPVMETQLEHEGVTYPGYLTQKDSCNKEWFITKNGDLIGQL
jgi:hypothetical protein